MMKTFLEPLKNTLSYYFGQSLKDKTNFIFHSYKVKVVLSLSLPFVISFLFVISSIINQSFSVFNYSSVILFVYLFFYTNFIKKITSYNSFFKLITNKNLKYLSYFFIKKEQINEILTQRNYISTHARPIDDIINNIKHIYNMNLLEPKYNVQLLEFGKELQNLSRKGNSSKLSSILDELDSFIHNQESFLMDNLIAMVTYPEQYQTNNNSEVKDNEMEIGATLKT